MSRRVKGGPRSGTFGEPGRSARITCQFRHRRSIVYELDCDGTQLSVRMQEAERDAWQVGAGMRQEGGAPELEACGANRADALRAVGAAWSSAGYSQVDWESIRQALAAVRAV